MALGNDLRQAARSLRLSPGSSVLVVAVLAVGIGANTAIFSLADALLLRVLPVREPERLVKLHRGENAGRELYATSPLWAIVRDEPSFDAAAAWSSTAFDLSDGGERELVDGLLVSASFFDVAGVSPALGRWPEDGENSAVVIAHDFWQARLGGRRDILGDTLAIDRAPFTIVGVTPEGFHGLEVGRRFDVAVPLAAGALVGDRVDRLRSRGAHWLRIALRLRPGDDPERATARLRARQPAWRERTLPDYRLQRQRDEYLSEPLSAVSASRGASFAQSRFRAPVLTLQAATALLLLIACGNVASLLLAKAPARRRELGIRAALGASRARLFRQLLLEASLLSALALPLAVLLSIWMTRLLVARASASMFLDVALDAKILAFAASLGGITTLLVGSLPAWRASREDPSAAIRSQSATGASTGGAGRALVPAQVAISLVLLTTASLFLRSWLALENVPLGFAPSGAWIVEIDAGRSPSREDLPRLHRRVLDAARRVPGLESAGTSALVPIGGMVQITIVDLPRDATLPESDRTVQKNVVSPGWFRAAGTPLVAGRTFEPADDADAPGVAVVNEAFVERLLPGRTSVGEEIREVWDRSTGAARPLRVVGVVRDTKFRSLKEPAVPTLYRPVAQLRETDRARPVVYATARSAGPAAARSFARDLVRAIAATDPDLSLSIQHWEDRVRATYWREETMAELAAAFGALGLVLTMLGLAGVTGQRVARGRRELAIRLVLGAERRRLARAVLSGALALVLAGVAAGIVASWWTAGLMESMLFDVASRDPRWLAGAAILLVAATAAASWFPARRVLGVNPASLLRQE